jgi:hypothetical protein
LILGVEGPFVNDFSLIIGRLPAEKPILWRLTSPAGGFLLVICRPIVWAIGNLRLGAQGLI